MACSSWNRCTGAGSNTSCGCGNDCGGKCSSCASNNSFGWGSCSCGSNCSGGCSGSCSGCSGSCSGSCTGCSGTCSGTCSGGCTGSCTNACKNNCGSGCNTGCTSTEAVNLYNTLSIGLNEKILAADMVNINKMLQLEAARRSKSVTSVAFSVGENATGTKVQQLQNNITSLGFNTTGNMAKDASVARSAGTELVDKTLDAYETTITSSSVGS